MSGEELSERQLGIAVRQGSSDSKRGSDGFHWESLYLFIPHCALLHCFFSLYRLHDVLLVPTLESVWSLTFLKN